MLNLVVLSVMASAQADGLEATLLNQVWVTVYDQDQSAQADSSGYGDPEDDPGFKLRRARAGFEGEDGDFSYRVVLGMGAAADGLSSGGGEAGIVDAWGGWRAHRHLVLRAGVQKVPFGREALLSSSDLVFQERAVTSTHISPGRELGMLAHATAYGLDLQLGVFNGNDSILGDDNSGMLTAFRAAYGKGPGATDSTWGSVDGLTWNVGANVFYNQDLAVSELAFGGDLLLRVQSLSLLAECDFASISPGDATVSAPGVFEETGRLGALLQVGWSVGILEPALRVEWFDDDTSTEDNGDLIHALAGVTAHLAEDRVRAGAGYVFRGERGGTSLPNDTVRGWLQFHY